MSEPQSQGQPPSDAGLPPAQCSAFPPDTGDDSLCNVRRLRGEILRLRAARAIVRSDEIESARCLLHNTGGQLAGNTQGSDVEWFARWLYGASNFGMGSVDTFHWSLTNDEFEKLGLLPDRQWTGKRWETLEASEAEAWMKLARLCLYAMPHIAERIGHRFMEQAKGLRIAQAPNDQAQARRANP